MLLTTGWIEGPVLFPSILQLHCKGRYTTTKEFYCLLLSSDPPFYLYSSLIVTIVLRHNNEIGPCDSCTLHATTCRDAPLSESIVQMFRSLRKWALGDHTPTPYQMVGHVDKRPTYEHVRQYNSPTCAEVAATVSGSGDRDCRR